MHKVSEFVTDLLLYGLVKHANLCC